MNKVSSFFDKAMLFLFSLALVLFACAFIFTSAGIVLVFLLVALLFVAFFYLRTYWFRRKVKAFYAGRAESTHLNFENGRLYLSSWSGDVSLSYDGTSGNYMASASIQLPPDDPDYQLEMLKEQLQRQLSVGQMTVRVQNVGYVVGNVNVEFPKSIATKENLATLGHCLREMLKNEYKGAYYAHWQNGDNGIWVKYHPTPEAWVIKKGAQTWRSEKPYDPNAQYPATIADVVGDLSIGVEDLTEEDIIRKDEWDKAFSST